MLIKTRGIIFRTIKYGESSLIVDIYTEQKGLKSYIVSGIRSKNAKTRSGVLQIMGMVEIICYDKEGKQLNRIKEIKADYLYKTIPFDMAKTSVGLFLTEICNHAIDEAEKNQELFDFIYNSYLFLDHTSNVISLFHHWFLIHFSKYLGFFPQDNWTQENSIFHLQEGMFGKKLNIDAYELNTENSYFLHQLLNISLDTLHHFSIPKSTRNALLDDLIKYYQLHLERFRPIKSLAILKEILN